jgi:hypothetical protein
VVALVALAAAHSGARRAVASAAHWIEIQPAKTICARGGKYAFWARQASPDKLLVYFQPGGGCFSYQTCKPGSTFFDDSVDESGPPVGDNPAGQGGIFDLSNPDNPFRDYSMLYVPSCTGDVHWGNHVQTYRSGPRRVTIRHKGFVNGSAALRWAYAHFRRPRSVFVTGCSAGSVGSAAFAPYVIRHYRGARLTQLGDSLAFVFHRALDLQTDYRANDNFPPWIPALRKLGPHHFTMARYYGAIARRYPRVTFSEFNFRSDNVQERFYEAVGGKPGGFPPALQRSLREIRAHARNFRTFTAPGFDHCVLPLDRFYSLAVGRTTLRGWVRELAAGRRPDSVR